MSFKARTFRAIVSSSVVVGVLGMSLVGCVAGPPHVATQDPRVPGPTARIAVNLVSDIDLTKHLHTGDWTAAGDQVAVGPGNWDRLCLQEQAIPDYYSVQMEFTRVTGKEGFGLLLTAPRASGSGFLFQLSAEGNRWAAIDAVKNIRHVHVPMTLQANAQRHVLEVKVRQKGVEAWLDGEPVLNHPTDYSDIQFQNWGFGNCSLGLISWYNAIVFHRVEVTQFKDLLKE